MMSDILTIFSAPVRQAILKGVSGRPLTKY